MFAYLFYFFCVNKYSYLYLQILFLIFICICICIFFLYQQHIYSHTWNKYAYLGGGLCCVTVNNATNISQLLFMLVDIDNTNYICIPIHPFSHIMDFCLSNFFSFNKRVICVFVQHV